MSDYHTDPERGIGMLVIWAILLCIICCLAVTLFPNELRSLFQFLFQ